MKTFTKVYMYISIIIGVFALFQGIVDKESASMIGGIMFICAGVFPIITISNLEDKIKKLRKQLKK